MSLFEIACVAFVVLVAVALLYRWCRKTLQPPVNTELPRVTLNGVELSSDDFDFDPNAGIVTLHPDVPVEKGDSLDIAYNMPDLTKTFGKGLHPSSGTYCPWCGVNLSKGEAHDDRVPHSTPHAVYCHICGAGRGEPCDAGLHG